MMRSIRAAAFVCAVWWAGSSRGEASPLFELAGDVEGGGGLTARITADGPAATYFNPALLSGVVPGLHLGMLVLSEQMGIYLDGRTTSEVCDGGNCDVPSASGRGPESFRYADTGEPIAEPTVPTEWLRYGTDGVNARPRQQDGSGQKVRAYQTVGLVTQVLRGRLTLGLFAMVPMGKFTTARSFYNDEREQYFSNSLHPELYSDRSTATSLAFGGGIRVTPKLSVGATFTLSLANSAAVPVYVSNLNDLNTLLLDSDIGVQASVSPHFGLVWDVVDRLRLGATIHTPQAFEIQTGFDYFLASGSEQSASIQFTHAYMPLQVATSALYELSSEDGKTLSIAGVAKWAQWSTYKDRHSERPTGEYRWADTLSVSLGARYEQGALTGRFDAEYQPTPVPPQTGRSNYVDNDRFGAALGGDYRFRMWDSNFRVGLGLVVHRLVARHQTKFLAPDDAAPGEYPQLVRDEVPEDAVDALGAPVAYREGLQTNNPGFPGFGSSGWVLGTSLRVAVQY